MLLPWVQSHIINLLQMLCKCKTRLKTIDPQLVQLFSLDSTNGKFIGPCCTKHYQGHAAGHPQFSTSSIDCPSYTAEGYEIMIYREGHECDIVTFTRNTAA